MRRIVTALGLSALMLVLFTGCITQQISIKVNENGGGTMTLRVGIAKQFIGMLEAMQQQQGGDAQGPFDELKNGLAEFPDSWNASAKDWSNDKFKGVEVTMEFSNANELKAQLTRMMQSGAGDEGGEEGGPEAPELYRDWVVTHKDGKFTIGVTMDTSGAAGRAEGNPQAAQMFAGAEVSLEVTMPKVDSFKAEGIGTQTENCVKWTAPLTDGKTFGVEVIGSVAGSAPEATEDPTDPGSESTPGGEGDGDGEGSGGDDEDF